MTPKMKELQSSDTSYSTPGLNILQNYFIILILFTNDTNNFCCIYSVNICPYSLASGVKPPISFIGWKYFKREAEKVKLAEISMVLVPQGSTEKDGYIGRLDGGRKWTGFFSPSSGH